MTETLSTTDIEPDGAPARPARRRLSRLLLVATVGWVLFLLAHVLLTGRWWLWMLVEPVPPLVLIVAPLLLLAILPFTRPMARWNGFVLGAVVLLSVPLAGFSLSPVSGGTELTPGVPGVKVFSWNTGYWDSGTGYLDKGSDVDGPEVFYDYLRRQQADVYLLSEHLLWNGGPVALDDEARIRAEFPGYQVNVEGELVTLSRLPIVAVHPRPGGTGPETWYWQGNKAQRTDVRVGGCVLSLYNVHIPQPIDPRLDPATSQFYTFAHGQYDRQQRELDALRADLAGNPNPLLVAGDFNSPWMGSLISLGDDVASRNPTEGAVLPLSFPAAGSGWEMPRLWRLDWVFTKGGIGIADYGFRSSPGLSDHLAQALTVSLPCERGSNG